MILHVVTKITSKYYNFIGFFSINYSTNSTTLVYNLFSSALPKETEVGFGQVYDT